VTRSADAHDLERFVTAQASVYADVLDELGAGRKQTHWMWFVFPQMRGLGWSPLAYRYGIATRAEARAYLDHPLLGPRLTECTALLLLVRGKSALEILGSPDHLKFRSSMTLFDAVARPEEGCFRRALVRYFEGQPDERTLALISHPL
jgi:uncharacterized protein (DUF1810 family)